MTIIDKAVLGQILFLVHGAVWVFAHHKTPTGETPPAFYRVFTVWREALGALIRHVKNYPTVSDSLEPFSEGEIRAMGEALTFHRGFEVSRREVASALSAQAQQFMRNHPFAYPPSQVEKMKALYRAWIAQEFAAEAERRYQDWRAREFAWWHHEEAKAPPRQPRSARSTSGWRHVLGLPAEESDPRAIKAAYRRLASNAHPDRGGSADAMARLNRAFEEAREELAFV